MEERVDSFILQPETGTDRNFDPASHDGFHSRLNGRFGRATVVLQDSQKLEGRGKLAGTLFDRSHGSRCGVSVAFYQLLGPDDSLAGR